MSLDKLKGEAKRLRAHLSDAHGVNLKHASVLEAVAASHGARNWTALANSAKPRPGLARRLANALHPETPQPLTAVDAAYDIDPGHLKFGVAADGKAHKLNYAAMRRHTLVVGMPGTGAKLLIEDILAQQVALGGGMLVLGIFSTTAAAQQLLQPVCDEVGRSDLSCVPCAAAPTTKAALDLKEVFARDQCVVVDIPLLEGPPGAAAAKVEEYAFQLCTYAFELAGQENRADAPFLIVAPLLPDFTLERWGALLAQARAFNVALVMATPSLAHLEAANPALMEAVLGNTATKVFLKPANDAEREIVKTRLGAPDAGGRYSAAELQEGLATLDTGEALVLHRGAVSRIKVRYLTPS